MNPYDALAKSRANHVALSPLSFLKRTAAIYPERMSVIHGTRRFTWRESHDRARRLASALARHGIGIGDTVAAICANTPEMFEAHFGVPMSGAVLNAINIRLDAGTIAYILDHGEAKVLLTDTEFAPTVKAALAKANARPLVIDIDDPMGPGGARLGGEDYESFIAKGDPNFDWTLPDDEWQAIALNYTSGTTGNPKGVVYHHRGAYLNALGNALAWNMARHPTYLWTLPMFHCNGWCFPWTVTAYAGTHVCLRAVTAKGIYDAVADHGVDHFCGAPIVLGMVVNARATDRRSFDHPVHVMTAGAAPPAAVLESMESAGFDVTHVYGLTETYGPAAECAWNAEEWDGMDARSRAAKKARQGVNYLVLEDLSVRDPETMAPVPADGATMGEVMFRGNVVMKGYLKNEKATGESLAQGWFHSGDLAVVHPDGYLEIKDRSKDIIISGGENISSIEVEGALYRHPAVGAAAVVAKNDDKWGETPMAFIELKDGVAEPSAEEIIAFCRENLAHFKCPHYVEFGPLPKTSTGKIQKFLLRERANAN